MPINYHSFAIISRPYIYFLDFLVRLLFENRRKSSKKHRKKPFWCGFYSKIGENRRKGASIQMRLIIAVIRYFELINFTVCTQYECSQDLCPYRTQTGHSGPKRRRDKASFRHPVTYFPHQRLPQVTGSGNLTSSRVRLHRFLTTLPVKGQSKKGKMENSQQG